jgi:transketolase
MLDDAGLRRAALETRLEIVRMMGAGKAHHFGGSLSAVDLVTAVYLHAMRYRPADPSWLGRDRFVMSKGHCVPAQYALLARLGVFPREELASLKQLGTRLQGHPAAHLLPGIEACTGSLGQGLSFANGIALAGRIQGLRYRVYCLVGDGETQEGQVWEAARTTARLCLGGVTAIVDANGLKAMDQSYCGSEIGNLSAKWTAFGWRVRQVDGHDMHAICEALDWAMADQATPSVVIARTVKGKGVSFMENAPEYHNAMLSADQLERALASLEAQRADDCEGRA